MRVKLSLPSSEPLFVTNFILGVADMNYGNHLGNDRVLTLAHESRIRFMRTFQETELTFCQSSLIMAEAIVQYKGQGYMGDKIASHLWIQNITEFGFDFLLRLSNEESLRDMAHIKTAMLFYNYDKEKISKTPKLFTDRFQKELN